MNEIFKVVLSLSFSGSLVIIVLFLCCPLLNKITSKRWQYYIWLVAAARLVLPLAPQTNLVDTLLQTMQERETKTLPSKDISLIVNLNNSPVIDDSAAQKESEKSISDGDFISNLPSNTEPDTDITPDARTVLVSYLWLIWLGIALSFLVRKITVYQSFINYVRAGWKEVSDIELLDMLAQTGELVGVKRPVELYTNNLVFSPLLIGFFNPRIILPSTSLPDIDFQYIVHHELIHYKRKDMFYKWLVQVVICIHWFNPLVWLMGKKLERICELACDEAVIQKLDVEKRRSYGDTLLHAIGVGGSYKNSITSVTLCQSAKLMKERLKAIMNFKKKSKIATALSVLFTVALMTGAIQAGAYTGTVSQDTQSIQENTQDTSLKQSSKKNNTYSKMVKKYYNSDNIVLFKGVFSEIDKAEQKKWLDKIYSDNDIAFFSTALAEMDADSSLIAEFAEKTYTDSDIAFFSVLINYMTNKELESWLERALDDKKTNFEAMLFNATCNKKERKAMEKKLDKQRLKEYKAYGITKKGDAYYYNKKLVGILLDHRPGSSAYALNINPEGIAIKITRKKNGKIKNVSYMTKKEIKRFLGGQFVEQYSTTSDNTKKVNIPIDISSVKNGEFIWIGTYQLEKGDKVYYDVSAKKGNRLIVGFAKPEQKNPSTTYHTISNPRTDGKLEIKSGAMAWKVQSGKYSLFIHSTEGALTDVNGKVTIVKNDAN